MVQWTEIGLTKMVLDHTHVVVIGESPSCIQFYIIGWSYEDHMGKQHHEILGGTVEATPHLPPVPNKVKWILYAQSLLRHILRLLVPASPYFLLWPLPSTFSIIREPSWENRFAENLLSFHLSGNGTSRPANILSIQTVVGLCFQHSQCC